MKNNIGISGFIEVYQTDLFGNKRLVHAGHNVIGHEFYAILTNHFDDNEDMALDNLWATDKFSPNDYFDGLISDVYISSFPYTYQGVINYACVASNPAANQFRITGTYTNAYGSTHRIYSATMGKSYIGSYNLAGQSIGTFNDYVASTGSFSGVVTLPNGETLTVVWTITFTTH